MFFETKPQTKNTKYDRVEFMKFGLGTHVVKILGTPKGMFSHYLPSENTSVKCLLDDCPICKNNRQLMIENPDNFRNIKGWNVRQYRHYFNVLDLTPVKTCPSCGAEIAKTGASFPVSCPSCNTIVTNVKEQQSNKIKLASISDTNANLINTLIQGFTDEQGNLPEITDFTFRFTVVNSDNKKTILPSVDGVSKFTTELDREKFYDVDRALMALTAEEIKDILKGISIKDIFAARKIKTNESESHSEADVFEAGKAVAKLFGD